MEIGQTLSPQITPPKSEQTALREAAKELETVFIAEMLKSSGFGKTPSEFGGGVGEEQFSSFLVTEYSKAMTSGKSLGLAEHIFNAMSRQS